MLFNKDRGKLFVITDTQRQSSADRYIETYMVSHLTEGQTERGTD